MRRCDEGDFETIWAIINDAAAVYEGVIPADCWRKPYMSRPELRHEIDEGVVFWGCEEDGELIGVMGIQQVNDVTLIRHAYVRPSRQREGVGGRLLSHLSGQTECPILIGTWADAVWAIRFYEAHGFQLVSAREKERLLGKYWSIPRRQVETSVVLADCRWFGQNRPVGGERAAEHTGLYSDTAPPEGLIRFCGAYCGECDPYQAFLDGDDRGLVNPETGYRCCWLPAAYPRGRDCPIKICCERQAIPYCGECDQLRCCSRMQAFYPQPGYGTLLDRMLDAVERKAASAECPNPGRQER